MASQRGSFRQRFPIIYAYGPRQEFLDTKGAIGASVEDRIRSIWPFIVRRVVKFQAGLKPRERVSFDTEDTLTELWVALAERDGKWSPDRGKYITFAGVIIDRILCEIHDKARTIHAPRNTSCRLKEYEAEAEAGTITKRRRKTAEDIRRTACGIHSIADDGCDLGGVVSQGTLTEVIRRETADERISVLKQAIGRLSDREAEVLVRMAGLFGSEARSARYVSAEDGCPVHQVRSLNAKARSKVRGFLTSIGYDAESAGEG